MRVPAVRNCRSLTDPIQCRLGFSPLSWLVGSRTTPDDDLKEKVIEAFIEGVLTVLEELFNPVESFIETHGNDLLAFVIGTPHPDAVFAAPSNGLWPALYDYYLASILPLSLTLWGLAIGLVILLETTSHLFSRYHRSKLKKRAVAGLLGILSWWWFAALGLRFVHALTLYIAPDLSNITLFQTLSFTGLGVLGTVVAMSIDLTLFLLIVMLYVFRVVALYLYVSLMPILVALWIPGVGPFAMVAHFARQLAGLFVPLLFMTVPVAGFLRIAHLLGTNVGPTLGGVGTWVGALVVPVAAILAPIVLVWQAGQLFRIGDRAARHASGRRARNRAAGLSRVGGRAVTAGRNVAGTVRQRANVVPATGGVGRHAVDAGRSRSGSARLWQGVSPSRHDPTGELDGPSPDAADTEKTPPGRQPAIGTPDRAVLERYAVNDPGVSVHAGSDVESAMTDESKAPDRPAMEPATESGDPDRNESARPGNARAHCQAHGHTDHRDNFTFQDSPDKAKSKTGLE